MNSASERALALRALAEAKQDWRYKAGIEEGQRRRGAEARSMEAERDLVLIAFYRADPVACAKLCDETLDKSGALLGRVREWAKSGVLKT